MKKLLLLPVLLGPIGLAQDPIGVKDTIRLALDKNQSIRAAGAAQKVAENRVEEAKAGFLPKVDYSESWTRSDNPVFVFSSLLTQHQFGEQNFEIGSLNRPDFLNNFQSLVTADQPLYDAGHTKHAVRSAQIGNDAAGEGQRLTRMEVIAETVRAYYGAVLSADQLNAANQSKRSAEADLEQALNVRAVGMSTDADVLSIRVLFGTYGRAAGTRRTADLDVARAALNDVIGLPLDTAHDLTSPLAPVGVPEKALADYESNSMRERPEARQAQLASSFALNEAAQSHGALLPEVTLHSAFEADRQRFYDPGGGNIEPRFGGPEVTNKLFLPMPALILLAGCGEPREVHSAGSAPAMSVTVVRVTANHGRLFTKPPEPSRALIGRDSGGNGWATCAK